MQQDFDTDYINEIGRKSMCYYSINTFILKLDSLMGQNGYAIKTDRIELGNVKVWNRKYFFKPEPNLAENGYRLTQRKLKHFIYTWKVKCWEDLMRTLNCDPQGKFDKIFLVKFRGLSRNRVSGAPENHGHCPRVVSRQSSDS